MFNILNVIEKRRVLRLLSLTCGGRLARVRFLLHAGTLSGGLPVTATAGEGPAGSSTCGGTG